MRIFKRALITGISGSGGSYLAEYIIKNQKKTKVFGIYRTKTKNLTNLIKKKSNLINCDLNNYNKVLYSIKRIKPDVIFHLAAQSHVGISFRSPFLTTQIDCIGALNVLDSVKTNSPSTKFYNAATSEIYGNYNKQGKINEESVMEPVSPYGVSKLAAYHFVKIYRESYKLFAVNGILFNHESPRRGLNFVTAKIVKGALDIKFNNQKYLELGNLDAKRDWGHAKDYVKAMWMMLQQKKPQDFVISTGKTKSVRDVLNYVFNKLKLKHYKNYIKINKRYIRPNELHHLKGNPKRAKKILRWKHEYTFETMLDEMIIDIKSRFYPDRKI